MKNVRISLRLSPFLNDKVKKNCEERGQTKNGWINQIIWCQFEKEESEA